MILVGLTGSIATGKTETARMFAAAGVPVFDSDDMVHELYSAGGAAVPEIRKIAPEAVQNDRVDRDRLVQVIKQQPNILQDIERVVHPLVRHAQDRFVNVCRDAGAPFVILDIPLLFETGRDRDVDCVIVVTCTPDLQRARALARPGMSAEKLDLVLTRQLPDAEKRKRADIVIDTSVSFGTTAVAVDAALRQLVTQAAEKHDA